MSKVIFPGGTIGIIGGGQLGRMMAVAAKQMGYKVIVLDPIRNGPCAQVSDIEINTSYDDVEGLKALFNQSDVVTYEFENIPYESIKKIQDLGYIPQNYRPLQISQDRALEKTTINKLGFNTAPFRIVQNELELERAIKQIGFPCVLKTCKGGYDGKGQIILKNKISNEARLLVQEHPCVLESFINYKLEISALVIRSTMDELTIYPIAENIHRNNILHQTIVPARITNKVSDMAQTIAKDFMRKIDFVGTLAIEMFVTQEDDILINEIAPRPHNSFHYTIEGCHTSQFEQHIRAICGLKLGDSHLRQPTVMLNILGQDLHLINKLLVDESFKNAKVHLYGKDVIKENRKMGHITFYNDSLELNLKRIQSFVKGE